MLADFVSKTKDQYLQDVKDGKGGDWTVAMGNEAGGEWAVACSEAWIFSEH